MTSARDEVLGRVRTALGRPGAPAGAGPARTASAGTRGPAGTRVPAGTAVPPRTQVPRRYRESADPGPAGELAERLAERLRDYGSTVRRATPGTLTAVAAAALAERGARQLVVPPGLDLPGLDLAGLGVPLIVDDGLDAAALDQVDGVITGAAVAIAETGTIVLDGSPGQGRRAVTLIPDYHLCILAEAQIVGLVPEALPLLAPGQPLTWISGPSATSDIELDRVQGVHGPRTLEVILAGPGPDPGSGSL